VVQTVGCRTALAIAEASRPPQTISISSISITKDVRMRAWRVVYLGRLLEQIYRAKLSAEFPERRFTVEFYEPPNRALQDHQLTFYQQHDS
jgi:selenophosphate synthetase-related protein